MCCSMPYFSILHHIPEFAQLMYIESGMPSNQCILCCPLLLLPSIFPQTGVFSNELAPPIRWPKYWSFSFSISPSNEYSGLISFRIDWVDLLAVQGFPKHFLQDHNSKASIFDAQPFLQSNCNVYMWLLEKPQLWLCTPLSAKWSFWFLIC